MARNLPTRGTGTSSAYLLADSSPLARLYVMDRVEVPLFVLPNFVAAADLVSMGAGTADLDEVSTFEFGGVECATTEGYSTTGIIPPQMDISRQQDFRVLMVGEASTSSASQVPVVLWDAVDTSAGTDAYIAAATALDTAITGSVDLGSAIPQWSPYGILLAASFGTTWTPGDDLLTVNKMAA
jgi:hypothetical protein